MKTRIGTKGDFILYIYIYKKNTSLLNIKELKSLRGAPEERYTKNLAFEDVPALWQTQTFFLFKLLTPWTKHKMWEIYSYLVVVVPTRTQVKLKPTFSFCFSNSWQKISFSKIIYIKSKKKYCAKKKLKPCNYFLASKLFFCK